jgi:chemotaxis protein CheY-P-specific phosphatase CheC
MDPPRGTSLVGDPVPSDLVDDGGRVAGVFIDLNGDVEGVAALLAPVASVPELLRPLVGTRLPRALDRRARSAFGELGNIVLCAAAGAIASLSGGVVVPSVPRIAVDRPEPLLAGEIHPRRSWPAYLVDSALSAREGSLRLRFLWLSSL